VIVDDEDSLGHSISLGARLSGAILAHPRLPASRSVLRSLVDATVDRPTLRRTARIGGGERSLIGHFDTGVTGSQWVQGETAFGKVRDKTEKVKRRKLLILSNLKCLPAHTCSFR
jgi:hypothetical protein